MFFLNLQLLQVELEFKFCLSTLQ